jgi:hypothetical protein
VRAPRSRTREELAAHFFPDVAAAKTPGDRELTIELNTRSCEVILLDLIKEHDKFFRDHGPGAMVLSLRGGPATPAGWVTLEGWQADREVAAKAGDQGVHSFLNVVCQKVEANTERQEVLLVLIDRSSQRLLTIPRDMPAQQIRRLQMELRAAAPKLILPRRAKPQGFGPS